MSESQAPLRMVIFGGTGQTGTELVAQAVALGHSVRVLARNPEKAKALPEQIELQHGDATDAAAVAAAIGVRGPAASSSSILLRLDGGSISLGESSYERCWASSLNAGAF